MREAFLDQRLVQRHLIARLEANFIPLAVEKLCGFSVEPIVDLDSFLIRRVKVPAFPPVAHQLLHRELVQLDRALRAHRHALLVHGDQLRVHGEQPPQGARVPRGAKAPTAGPFVQGP